MPVEEGQTISQPFMVAVMTHRLDVRAGQRVLEIGTGTGYQTAILAATRGACVYGGAVAGGGHVCVGRFTGWGWRILRRVVGMGLWGGLILARVERFDRILVTAGA